jgi:chitinase
MNPAFLWYFYLGSARMFKLRHTLAICCLLMSSILVASATPTSGPEIVAYVFPQDAPLQAGQIDARRLTRVNYAFANTANGRMVPGFSHDAANFAYLHSLKRDNPSLSILVSVGGWLWSTNFSDICLSKQSRDQFIQSAMEFLRKYDLDGLDIDWEYPGMVGAGHPVRQEDKQNFTSLLSELRMHFEQEQKRTHKKLYLTIAAGASDEYLAHTEMGKDVQYLDTVNLMAYDYYEPESDAITGHHAPLFTNPADPKKASANASVTAFEKAGVPAKKIILGVPFYGHIWGNVADHSHGLFQSGKPVPRGYAPYSLITQTMLDHGFTRYWDAAASAPYLYNFKDQVFVSYEDSQSLAAKCKYIQEQRLGGVMFWDYSSDPSGTLLTTLSSCFEKSLSERPATK